jgi:hypothetical protein
VVPGEWRAAPGPLARGRSDHRYTSHCRDVRLHRPRHGCRGAERELSGAHRPAKVGKLFGAKLKTFGGVAPATWRITLGPLPRGIRFDRTTGILAGIPKKAGTYRVTFEVTDSLGIVAKKTLKLIVIPAVRK